MIEIVIAEKAGACYGVERALGLVSDAARNVEGRVYTLGALIHNPQVVTRLAAEGVSAVERPDECAPGSTLVLRAHGVTPCVEECAQAAGVSTIDATCPYVKRVHKAVERLEGEGYQVVVVGESGHPEVEGICGHATDAVVVGSADEADNVRETRRIGVVAQTTLERDVLRSVAARLIGRCSELHVIDTICEATSERQRAAADLASRVDVMIVVGGRMSANTRHLADVCSAHCEGTHHVERVDELMPSWFEGVHRVGVTAGASTPADQIQGVTTRIAELCN